MKNFDPALLKFLESHNLSFSYYEHIPVFTVPESEQIKKSIPGVHTKNLFLTDKKGGFYLISIQVDKRFPITLFRKALGLKDLTFTSAEQLHDQLKLLPGSVSLFGLINAPSALKVFLDKEIREAKTVGRHPNRNDATITIDHATLEKFLRATDHRPKIVTFDETTVDISEAKE